MTDARERLETAIRAALPSEYKHYSRLVSHITDAVERALAPEPSAPSPVWPGVEGEGLERVRKVYNRACDVAKQGDDVYRFAWTAAAAHLWRALVASLPSAGLGGQVWIGGALVPRGALAALADPYDGGGKGVGK